MADKSNKDPTKEEIEHFYETNWEARYLRDFILKYAQFYWFTSNGVYGERYKTGVGHVKVLDPQGFVGVSGIDHLDEFHTAQKIIKERRGSRYVVEAFEEIKRTLRQSAVSQDEFSYIRNTLLRILSGEEYQNYIKKLDQKAKEEALLLDIVRGNTNEFFPTPPSLFQESIAPNLRPWIANYKHRVKGRALRILEPSAGVGTLANEVLRYVRPLVGYDTEIQLDVAEYFGKACQYLEQAGFNVVHCDDFLEMQAPLAYDLIVMNPPFSNDQDIDHVLHAWTMLQHGGLLVAVMSAGAGFRSNKKAVAFREWVERNGGSIESNEEGAFKREDSIVKTGVNTITLSVEKK